MVQARRSGDNELMKYLKGLLSIILCSQARVNFFNVCLQKKNLHVNNLWMMKNRPSKIVIPSKLDILLLITILYILLPTVVVLFLYKWRCTVCIHLFYCLCGDLRMRILYKWAPPTFNLFVYLPAQHWATSLALETTGRQKTKNEPWTDTESKLCGSTCQLYEDCSCLVTQENFVVHLAIIYTQA